MNPPSYDETSPVMDSPLAKNTDQVYNLRAYFRISALAFILNFPDYDPKLPIRFGSREGSVAAVITSPEGKIIGSGKALSSNFQEKVLTIDYECYDLNKLRKIHRYLQFKHLKDTAVPYGIGNRFCSSMIKYFQHDEDKDTYFIKVAVENPSFVGMRRLYAWDICDRSHAYSLHVKYLNARIVVNTASPTCYNVLASKNPVSTLLMHGDKTLSYEKLSKGNDEAALTVVYKTESLEELNTVKIFLANPRYCQNPEEFRLRDSTDYQIHTELSEGNHQCTTKNPFTLKLCCNLYFIQLDNYIYFDCNSHGSSCRYWEERN